MKGYNQRVVDRTKYSVQEHPFIDYDHMKETATNSGATYINYFAWRGYFTVHSCLLEAQVWHDINQDHRPSQLVFDAEDHKWHYEELNTMYQPACTCEKCKMEVAQ